MKKKDIYYEDNKVVFHNADAEVENEEKSLKEALKEDISYKKWYLIGAAVLCVIMIGAMVAHYGFGLFIPRYVVYAVFICILTLYFYCVHKDANRQ